MTLAVFLCMLHVHILSNQRNGVGKLVLEELQHFLFAVERREDVERHEERDDEALVLGVRQTNHHELVPRPDVQVVLLHCNLHQIPNAAVCHAHFNRSMRRLKIYLSNYSHTLTVPRLITTKHRYGPCCRLVTRTLRSPVAGMLL